MLFHVFKWNKATSVWYYDKVLLLMLCFLLPFSAVRLILIFEAEKQWSELQGQNCFKCRVSGATTISCYGIWIESSLTNNTSARRHPRKKHIKPIVD